MDDGQLMEAVAAGNAEAVELLVHRYRKRLLRFMIGRGEGQEDALDITQEVLARVCSKASTFNGASLSAWIFQVARNLQIDVRRRKNSRLSSALEPGEQTFQRLPASRSFHPETHVRRKEIRQRVGAAIQALPPRQREVIELRLLGELSLEEISETVGLTLGGVKSTLHNAIARLRESLADLEELTYVQM